MNIQDIRNSVDGIKEMSFDDEAAHSREDDLYYAFIVYIAKGVDVEYAEMAKEVLKTKQIDFARWCA
jgi:hypothetical protein